MQHRPERNPYRRFARRSKRFVASMGIDKLPLGPRSNAAKQSFGAGFRPASGRHVDDDDASPFGAIMGAGTMPHVVNRKWG